MSSSARAAAPRSHPVTSVTAVIYVAARLGIADMLSSGPKPLGELAKATGADQPALARLLTALATIGICARAGQDRYALTEMGAALDGTPDPSFKAWAIFEGEMLSKSWNGMLETIMTGKTAAQLLGFGSSFDLMARSPENVRIFNAAMADLTGLVTADLLAAYDFGRISHLMDVGGGAGELIGAVARRYPHIRGTVFDLPRCAEAASAHLANMGVADRVKLPGRRLFRVRSGYRRRHHPQKRDPRLGRSAQLRDPAKLPARRPRRRERCCWSNG